MSMEKWFYDMARIGKLYNACSTGAVTLSTVSTTLTGLAISNDPTTDKLLVIKNFKFAPSSAPGGVAVVGLAVSPAVQVTANTHTTPMVIHNSILTGSDIDSGAGKVDSAATLVGTPVWLRPMSSVVAGSSITPTRYIDESMGDLILPPGTHVSLSYLTTAAAGIASVTWAEIDR